MTEKKVNINIDGEEHSVEEGQMLIEVTDQLGVYIPRFCYHKKLSIAANCRMCLVEEENTKNAIPACATPVSEGMVIKTKSNNSQTAQQATMEFLLINHPLDCPICVNYKTWLIFTVRIIQDLRFKNKPNPMTILVL